MGFPKLHPRPEAMHLMIGQNPVQSMRHVSREGRAVLMKEVHTCSLHRDRIRVQPRHTILFPPLDKES